jgi:hypothetical protein
LSGCSRPSKYWSDLKKQLVDQEGFTELFANSEKLPMPSEDGKMRGTEVVNTVALLRIVQSVPSKNAEPFKRWRDLKAKLVDTEGFAQLYANIGQLKLPAADGKIYETDVANMTTVLRIIQSIPSKSAEPFKQWLAKVGEERLQEINDPEISIQRAIYNYREHGMMINGFTRECK